MIGKIGLGQIVPERSKYQYSASDGLYARISDTTRFEVVPLAHVFLMYGKDTVKLVSNMDGIFVYKSHFPDTIRVQVKALGFKPFSGLYIPKKHGLDIRIILQQEAVELNEVIVTAKSILMVVKGDTLQYNTNEVKTLQGAKMGEILKKLPGVSMDEGLKVNGVPIQRIYVNSDTLFKGTDALHYIAADNVKDVKVFDERNKEDLSQGLRHGRRKKVMDVTTKREVTQNEITKTARQQNRSTLRIGGGVDVSRERTSEFPEKFLVNYTYEKGSTMTSGITNGILFSVDYSNLFLNDKREFGEKFHYSKKFRKISYRSQYVYRNTTTYQNQWEEQDYFPTNRFATRRYEKTSSEKNTLYKYGTLHEFGFRIKEVSVRLIGSYIYDVDKNRKNSRMLSMMDENVMNSANVRNYDRNDASKGNAKFLISTNPKKKNNLNVFSELNFAQGGRKGWQNDTLKTSSRQIFLERDWNSNQISWKSYLKFSSVISPLFKLFLKGSYDYSESTSKGIGENRLTGSLDTNNTRNYTFYSSSYKINGKLTYYGDRIEISGGSVMSHQIRNQVERFPVREQMKDRFLFLSLT